MSQHIEWSTDFKEAFERARKQNKRVLLDFFNPK